MCYKTKQEPKIIRVDLKCVSVEIAGNCNVGQIRGYRGGREDSG